MSSFSMARCIPLTAPLLGLSEVHGRRLDAKAIARKVRDEPSLTWTPEGVTGDPLALADRLAGHVKGAFVPKSNAPLPTVALHMIVMLPDSVPVATKAEAQAAMELAVEFAQHVYGGKAVFSARMDRDEVSLNNVDVFLAPRYVKTTKKASKDAISMTKHSKELAVKHGHVIKGKNSAGKEISSRSSMQAQGRALQAELATWLTAKGFAADRGKAKTKDGNDWVSPEIAGARKDRAAAERDRAAIESELSETLRAAVVGKDVADRMMQGAAEQHSEIIDDAKAERDEIIAKGEAERRRLVAAAQTEHDRTVGLATEKKRAADLAAAAVADRETAVKVDRDQLTADQQQLETDQGQLAVDRDQLAKDRDALTDGQRELLTAKGKHRTEVLRVQAKNADLDTKLRDVVAREAVVETTIATRVAAAVAARLAEFDDLTNRIKTAWQTFEPQLRLVVAAQGRLAAAPAAVRAWLDGDSRLAAATKAAPQVGADLAGLMEKPASPASSAPVEGPSLAARSAHLDKGGSGL